MMMWRDGEKERQDENEWFVAGSSPAAHDRLGHMIRADRA